MDAHHSSRHPPLKHWADGDTGGSHRLPAAAPDATPRRSALREERHPNAVTAPPIHRGSMPPTPWRGFWKSIAAGVLAGVPGVGASKVLALDSRLRGNDEGARHPREGGDPGPTTWERAAAKRRTIFLLFTLLSAALATLLFAKAQPDYDSAWLRYGQITLFAILSTWVVTGFTTALMGFWVTLRGDAHALSARSVRHHTLDEDVRTAIIMPICNEDVATVFAGLRATCESMATTGHARQFDVFVLSDSSDPAIVAAERAAWAQLREALAAQRAAQPGEEQVEVYYRLRERRTHRKAGNVADFCRRWGRDYRYMVVLDADSVMSGDCLSTLVKLM
ncbi:MAG: glycosyltransferase, partial [Pseudomonadota bacterium]